MVSHQRIEGGVLFEHPKSKWKDQPELLLETAEYKVASRELAAMVDLHFPIAFPEVFLRERAGFDVILGNPPWEEAMLEEDAFWARHFPGLRALLQREQETRKAELREERPDLVKQYNTELKEAEVTRRGLTNGPFPGMGTGDPDLYKAFCWRFWFLVATAGGRIGVVLPRSALAAKGSEEFRWTIFGEAELTDATTLLNTGRWVFDMEPRYTVALVGIQRGVSTTPRVDLSGPYNSRSAYDSGLEHGGASFVGEEVLSWNDSASLPLFPSQESVEVFAQLRKAPRMDLDRPGEWRVRPHTELHATNDKKDKKTGEVLMDLESELCPKGFWPIYKGESFDLWEPDTGTYYAWGDPDVLKPILQQKRIRGSRHSKSVFHEFDSNWSADTATLPCNFPRIAFRDVTNRTNQRTVVCALAPANVFIANQAPYLLLPRGDWSDATYLLGVLSSIPLDWYARRFVETHVNFFIFNPFPVPRPASDNPLRQRVIDLAGRLACPDDRFADWATEVGVECGPLVDDKKQGMIHELDAVVAHLYGLSEEHLVHIFETFHEGWEYHARLKETLKHFRKWRPKA